MDLIVCPHCNSHRVVTQRFPKDVVVVMACPSCSELMIFFRKKVIALSRDVLKEGTMEEKTSHLAGVIAEFIDPDMFEGGPLGDGIGPREIFSSELFDYGDSDEDGDKTEAKISERELEHFIKADLHRIDDSGYFRKHFG